MRRQAYYRNIAYVSDISNLHFPENQIISESGQLHVFGDGAEGQLGVGMQITELEGPRLLESLASQNFVHVACGESHSAAITGKLQSLRSFLKSTRRLFRTASSFRMGK